MDLETLRGVCKVARLELGAEEEKLYLSQFQAVFGHFKLIEDFEPFEGLKAEGSLSVLRDDKAIPSKAFQGIAGNFPKTRQGRVAVQR